MKTFKQFTSEQKDISQPLIGFCSAGGPPNQRSILEAVRTRRISDSGTVLTDKEKFRLHPMFTIM